MFKIVLLAAIVAYANAAGECADHEATLNYNAVGSETNDKATVTVVCKAEHVFAVAANTEVKCNAGTWEKVTDAIPECIPEVEKCFKGPHSGTPTSGACTKKGKCFMPKFTNYIGWGTKAKDTTGYGCNTCADRVAVIGATAVAAGDCEDCAAADCNKKIVTETYKCFMWTWDAKAKAYKRETVKAGTIVCEVLTDGDKQCNGPKKGATQAITDITDAGTAKSVCGPGDDTQTLTCTGADCNAEVSAAMGLIGWVVMPVLAIAHLLF